MKVVYEDGVVIMVASVVETRAMFHALAAHMEDTEFDFQAEEHRKAILAVIDALNDKKTNCRCFPFSK